LHPPAPPNASAKCHYLEEVEREVHNMYCCLSGIIADNWTVEEMTGDEVVSEGMVPEEVFASCEVDQPRNGFFFVGYLHIQEPSCFPGNSVSGLFKQFVNGRNLKQTTNPP
jgi:hypothetical protein